MNKFTGSLPLAVLLAATMWLGACNKPPKPMVQVAASAATTGNVSDIDVTEHVTTALRQSESLKGFDINVVTNKGDVRLIGVVNSQAQVDEAIKIARASDGAHSIHDELTVKK